MKKIIVLLSLILSYVHLYSQNGTFIIMQQGLDYEDQSYFTSGQGNELNQSLIKNFWNEGKRITDASYTIEGWFVCMSKDSGYDMQTYMYDNTYPINWIKEKYKDDYIISDIAYGNGKWFVVMSQTSWKMEQELRWGSISSHSSWIKEYWQKGFYITDVVYSGESWGIVMTKTSKYSNQRFSTQTSFEKFYNDLKTNYEAGYNPTTIQYGNGVYICVSSETPGAYKPMLKTLFNLDNIQHSINLALNENYSIANIGGGYYNNQQFSSNQNNSSSYNALNSLGNIINAVGGLVGGGSINASPQYGNGVYNGGSYGGGTGSYSGGSSGGSSTYTKCTSCNGTGRCSSCKGKGYKFNSYSGHDDECPNCRGKGSCPICYGKGSL